MRMIKPGFRRRGLLAAGLLLCSGLLATPTMAASVIYNFSGNVTGVDSLVSSQFNNSMTMSGTMTVDMVDQDPGSDSTGIYAVQSFKVNIGGYEARFDGSSLDNNAIVLDIPVAGDGFFSVMDQINGENVNFLGVRNFTMGLFGPSTIWDSDTLPGSTMSVPSVSSFASINEFRLAFGPVGVQAGVSGVLTSLTAVPLPAAVILFGAGLISLVGLGAGGLRNLRGSRA